MKKLWFLTVLLISLSILLTACSSLPFDRPTLTVRSTKDDIEFKASTNGGTWFDSSDGKGGNSFDLGMYDVEKLPLIDEVKVSCNTTINLDLSFSKDIQLFQVYSIQGDSGSNQKLIKIESPNYTITMPSGPGEYAYVVETKWDDSHDIRFIFKFKCE